MKNPYTRMYNQIVLTIVGFGILAIAIFAEIVYRLG